MDNIKDLVKKNYLIKIFFNSSVKDETTGDDDVKLDGHTSDKNVLTCNKIWNEFNMKKYR